MTFSIDSIVIGRRRSRKQLGDVEGLASSIRDLGLLHPIVLDDEHHLIAGCRFIMNSMKASVPNVPLKKRGGRRAEFTQAQVERALTAAGGLVTSAAKRLGCDPKTVYR